MTTRLMPVANPADGHHGSRSCLDHRHRLAATTLDTSTGTTALSSISEEYDDGELCDSGREEEEDAVRTMPGSSLAPTPTTTINTPIAAAAAAHTYKTFAPQPPAARPRRGSATPMTQCSSPIRLNLSVAGIGPAGIPPATPASPLDNGPTTPVSTGRASFWSTNPFACLLVDELDNGLRLEPPTTKALAELIFDEGAISGSDCEASADEDDREAQAQGQEGGEYFCFQTPPKHTDGVASRQALAGLLAETCSLGILARLRGSAFVSEDAASPSDLGAIPEDEGLASSPGPVRKKMPHHRQPRMGWVAAPSRRHRESILTVARRWGIHPSDADELCRNVETLQGRVTPPPISIPT